MVAAGGRGITVPAASYRIAVAQVRRGQADASEAARLPPG